MRYALSRFREFLQEMVVGEGLFVAVRLTLRAALKRVASLRETRTLVEASHPSPVWSNMDVCALSRFRDFFCKRWWWGKDSNLRSL